VAVDHHLGSQLGYPASREPAGTQPPPRACDGIYDEPVDGEERLHRDVDAAWIVFTSALLSPLVGVARVAIWDPRNLRLGARRTCDFVQLARYAH
jgi:hypothetical protein